LKIIESFIILANAIYPTKYRGADKSLARPGRKQANSPHFMELGVSLPHAQESTTYPYSIQINPFLCPSHFGQAQLVSVLVGLRTYQHLDIVFITSYMMA